MTRISKLLLKHNNIFIFQKTKIKHGSLSKDLKFDIIIGFWVCMKRHTHTHTQNLNFFFFEKESKNINYTQLLNYLKSYFKDNNEIIKTINNCQNEKYLFQKKKKLYINNLCVCLFFFSSSSNKHVCWILKIKF